MFAHGSDKIDLNKQSYRLAEGWFLTQSKDKQNPSDSCIECGLPNQRVKIVGGKTAARNEYPWMVSIHDAGDYVKLGAAKSQFCGGAIIGRNWILTAAHCVKSYARTPLMVVIGLSRHNLASFFDSFSLPKVAASIKVHPKYNRKNQEFDAAIIELVTPITFSNTIRPICIAESETNIEQKKLVITGWGSTSEEGPASDVLREVEVQGFSNQFCSEKYKVFDVPITDNMICAGFLTGGKDACQGDSGGPLIQKCGDRYVLVGIVSFGIGCAQADFPGIYTKVNSLKNWIQNITNNVCNYKCNTLN
ncbi:Transmembrane protease serine 9 [Chamberlinius hualienensis]